MRNLQQRRKSTSHAREAVVQRMAACAAKRLPGVPRLCFVVKTEGNVERSRAARQRSDDGIYLSQLFSTPLWGVLPNWQNGRWPESRAARGWPGNPQRLTSIHLTRRAAPLVICCLWPRAAFLTNADLPCARGPPRAASSMLP